EERAAIGLFPESPIEHRDDAEVVLVANEPAEALPELEDGRGQGVVVERARILLRTSFEDGVGGHPEGQAGDDEHRKRFAADVDALPEAGSPQHKRARILAELLSQLLRAAINPLSEGEDASRVQLRAHEFAHAA